jgi:hypothetical protein
MAQIKQDNDFFIIAPPFGEYPPHSNMTGKIQISYTFFEKIQRKTVFSLVGGDFIIA